jgi:hypothetical protein
MSARRPAETNLQADLRGEIWKSFLTIPRELNQSATAKDDGSWRWTRHPRVTNQAHRSGPVRVPVDALTHKVNRRSGPVRRACQEDASRAVQLRQFAHRAPLLRTTFKNSLTQPMCND